MRHSFFNRISRSAAALLAVLCFTAVPAYAERVIVVGDSITGHSKNLGGKAGYYYQVNDALEAAGVKDVELVPLGGSGQAVDSWRSVVKKSFTEDTKLDIPGILVKTELDKGADTLIIILGVNDVLAPYKNLENVATWKDRYQLLINDLRERTKFRKLILFSPVMVTENSAAYRNRLLREMDKLVFELAKENSAEAFSLYSEFEKAWKLGRMSNPAFRISLDFVHPNKTGHGIIAEAILRAIGQAKAADIQAETNRQRLGKAAQGEPGMMLQIVNQGESGTLVIQGETAGLKAKTITADLPEGWKLDSVKMDGSKFTLNILAQVKQLKNTVTVTAKAEDGKSISQKSDVYAPWLVCTGLRGDRWFNDKQFDPTKQKTDLDDTFAAGRDYLSAGKWFAYYPTADVTGGDDPDSVDFGAVSASSAYEQAFMVRYIYSEKGGKTDLQLKTKIFAGYIGATVYLNGTVVYAAFVPRKPVAVPVELKPGWNLLAVKCSHVTWQFQLSAGFVQTPDGADVAAFRYALGPEKK